MVLRAWFLLMLALCLDASVTRAQSAQPARPLRVLLQLRDVRDAELLSRLRGQTSDLAVVVEELVAQVTPSAGAEGANSALALCNLRGADALIWADWSDAREAGVWLALATCGDRRLLARQVTLEGGAASSGLTEACALVLRGALSVLSQGGSIGVHIQTSPVAATRSAAAPTSAPAQAETASEPAAPAAPPAVTTAAAATVPRLEVSPASVAPDSRGRAQPSRQSERLQVYGALAVQEAWDGASARGQPALQVGLGLGGRVHQLALTGNIGLPVELRDAYTRIVLSRHGIAAGWRANVWRRGPWRVRGGLDLGTAIYQRSVQASSNQAKPRDSKLAFAPALGGSLELSRALGPVWLSLGTGVEGVLVIPQFVYRSESGQRDALTLWPLVPRVFVALAWESS